MSTFVTHDMGSGGGGAAARTGETVTAATTSGSRHTITKNVTISSPSVAASRFFSLPSPGSATAYDIYELKDGSLNAGTYSIDVNTASGTIDGGSSIVVNVDGAALKFFTDGTNWFVS